MAWVSCQDCYHYCKWYIIIHKTNKPLLTQKEGNDDSQYNKDPYKDKGKCRGLAEVAIPWICVTDKLKWSWKIHMDLKMPRLGNRYRVLR